MGDMKWGRDWHFRIINMNLVQQIVHSSYMYMYMYMYICACQQGGTGGRQLHLSKKMLKFPKQDSNPQSLVYMASALTAKSNYKHTARKGPGKASVTIKEQKLCRSS